MKILWVKGGGLVPPDTGGKIRSYNLLRELPRNHAVTFFSFHDARDHAPHLELHNMFEKVVCVPLALSVPKSGRERFDYLRSFFTRGPYATQKFCRPQVARELRALLSAQSFDVIVCDFLLPAPLLPWDHATPTVLFAHNVEAMIWRRHFEVSRNPLWKMVSWCEWKATEKLERDYSTRADQVIAVSPADAAIFAGWVPAEKLSVIPTGVDVEYFQPSTASELPDSLIFTGSMDWLPNEDSMIYFLDQIFPRIREQVPQITLHIVGRRPSAKLHHIAAQTGNVHLTGWVDDIRPFLARAAVSIVPLRIGGGTRLKIFEAMAMAKPVVSTTLGAEGLPATQTENILLADTPAQFADAVIDLLRDPQKARQIGTAAHQLVKQKYSWPAVATQFAAILQRVAKNSPSTIHREP